MLGRDSSEGEAVGASRRADGRPERGALTRREFLHGSLVTAAAVTLAGSLAAPRRAGAEQILAVQLHLHGSLSEGTASMLFHTHQAELANVDCLWWSDHAARTTVTPVFEFIRFFGFENGLNETFSGLDPLLEGRGAKQWERGIQELSDLVIEVVDERAHLGQKSLKMSGRAPTGQVRRAELAYRTYRDLIRRSLLSEVTIRLAVSREDWQTGGAAYVDCKLSNDIDGGHNRLVYWISDDAPPADVPPNRFYVPVPGVLVGEWKLLELPVSEDARRLFPEGDDQSLVETRIGIRAQNGATTTAYFDDFSIEVQGPTGDALFAKQLETLTERYSTEVQHYVTWETEDPADVSGTPQGIHLNVFLPSSGALPVIDYASPAWAGTTFPNNVIDYVHGLGGIVAYTHMFGYGGPDAPPERVEQQRAELLANSAYGADLLEMYVDRKRPLADFLSVWDSLSAVSIRITGIGVSDQHIGQAWSTYVNPFVTWVHAASSSPADLVDALRRGRAFFGDPFAFGPGARIDLIDVAGRFRMGDVVTTSQPCETVRIEVDGAAPGDLIRLVINGNVTEEVVAQAASVALVRTIATLGPTFVRCEVYAPDESAKAFSNPVYFVAGTQGLGSSRRAGPPSSSP